MKFVLGAATASFLVFFHQSVFARPFNYQDVPLGERSFGMGGAGMAFEGDVSQTFLNPGTMALMESSHVSASLSAYARIDTRTGEYVSLFRSARDNVSRGGFLAMPSMVGGNLKWKDFQWGGAILVPYLFKNSGTVPLGTDYVGSFESSFESVWMGAFMATRIGMHHLGASLFYASQSFDESFFFVRGSNVDPTSIRYLETRTSSNGFVVVLGNLIKLSPTWNLGFSLRTRALGMGGEGSFVDAQSGETGGEIETFRGRFMPLPWRLSVGFSHQYSDALLLVGDLHFYTAMKGSYGDSTSEIFEVDAKAIPNVALGMEYKGWKHTGFRLGWYTNLSSAREVRPVLSAINDKVHMFGGSGALVFYRDENSISIGGYAQGGQGSSVALQETLSIVPRSNYVYGFVVASSYRF